jgi:hypothetical protein
MSRTDIQDGHEIRHSQDTPQKKRDTKPVNVKPVRLEGLQDGGQKATFLVDEKRKDELKQLADDLAIVCPLVDGRMQDLGEGK